MKKTFSIIYGLFGIGAIVYGATALLFPAVLESGAAQSFRFAHILREQGAAAIFIGLMAFWCIFNYERRRGVHYFLMVLTFLLSLVRLFCGTLALDESAIQQRSVHRYFANGRA